MLYLIVNPASSSGRGRLVWEHAESVLKARGISYRCFLLEKPGDGRRIAGELRRKKRFSLIIVGGDGTIGEVLSGFSSLDGITLGFLPTGSGNDFARGMRIPRKTDEALRHLLTSRRRRPIDIGQVCSHGFTRSFAVSSGIGYDAAVCHAVDTDPAKALLNRLHLGKMIYALNALKLLLTMKPFSARIILDERQLLAYDRIYFAAAMNTPFEGGGFRFAPKARAWDGELDLIIAEGLPKWKVLLVMPLAYFGLHTRFRGIHLLRCSQARLIAQEPQCVHADGEHAGFSSDVRFSLRPEKPKLIS